VVEEEGVYHTLPELVERNDVPAVKERLALKQHPDTELADGHTGLWVAARDGNAAMVDLLLDYGALADHADAYTKATPLLAAVERGHAEAARLLVLNGANWDAKNVEGKTPRSAVKGHPALEAMMKRYKAEGAAAWEDPPGYWKLMSDGPLGSRFYYLNLDGHSRWSRPASCSWVRSKTQSGQTAYYNQRTKQVRYTMPDALAWKFVRDQAAGQDAWFNYRTNATSIEIPGELPEGMVDAAMENSDLFWFNRVTGASSFEAPEEVSWRKVSQPKIKKGVYWFNERTGATSWDQPVDASWRKAVSPTHDNEEYYWNQVTGETTWMLPASMGWVETKAHADPDPLEAAQSPERARRDEL